MLTIEGPVEKRDLKTVNLHADLAVVGGGIAGLCAAVSAARAGARVVLIHDRPVLGGNASSEIRLWLLGATCHMGSNNLWAREAGLVDEILVENMYRNREGNPYAMDGVLLDLALAEPNLTLLLNTAACACTKAAGAPERIASVRAFNAQNSTQYEVSAPLFCDASGDGILAFTAGAAFRMGAEAKEEFGEGTAPDESYGSLLGHSMYFYTRDAGKPVAYVPPAFAMPWREVETKVPRYRDFHVADDGCRLWWIEFGGRLDTVHDTEKIKWELWRVAYGVWDYFKNSGKFPAAANLTLDWIGAIPGKRESRRFEGDYLLTQHDVIGQRRHDDDVAFGGWALDLHPADGVYSALPGCTHWRSKGVYPIPYRSLYSRNVPNLFLAGRIISVTHAAFGSTRVMATLGCAAQAVGQAAALCARAGLLPRDLAQGPRLEAFRLELLRTGQHVPGVALHDPDDLAPRADISASSDWRLAGLPADAPMLPLDYSAGQWLPAPAGRFPAIRFELQAAADTTAVFELRTCSRLGSFTPDTTLARREVPIPAGPARWVAVDFGADIDQERYVLACVLKNDALAIRQSSALVTGLLLARQTYQQQAPANSGVESFEMWMTRRRPQPQNLAFTLAAPLAVFGPANLTSGVRRPTSGANAWVADPADPAPAVTLRWDKPVTLGRVVLSFDNDANHPMESVLMGHPERVMPYCVKSFRLTDGSGRVLYACQDNHQTRREIALPEPQTSAALKLEVLEMNGPCPAAVFELRCYER
jgi:hypothetical protein